MKAFIKYFMLLAIIGFLLLGIWQLDRLAWKNTLLSSAKNNSSLAPINFTQEEFHEGLLYRLVNFSGALVENDKLVLIPESYKQEFYYRIMAPIKIGKKNILIDFGLTKNKKLKIPGNIKSRGIFFNFDRKNIFYPKNNPQKLVWYNTDYQTMQKYFGINIEPYYIKIVPGFSVSNELVIKPFATSYRNDHLMYAITWFLLAFFCSIIFYFRVKTNN